MLGPCGISGWDCGDFHRPSIDVAQAALETLAHELFDASVGNDEGHKGAFKACAQAIGFLPPMTSTPASPRLAPILFT